MKKPRPNPLLPNECQYCYGTNGTHKNGCPTKLGGRNRKGNARKS